LRSFDQITAGHAQMREIRTPHVEKRHYVVTRDQFALGYLFGSWYWQPDRLLPSRIWQYARLDLCTEHG
jgi:hypothetical protein